MGEPRVTYEWPRAQLCEIYDRPVGDPWVSLITNVRPMGDPWLSAVKLDARVTYKQQRLRDIFMTRGPGR